MAKAPVNKKTAKKTAKPRKAATKAPANATVEEAPVPKKNKKKTTKAHKAPVDTRIITMHNNTRLIHRGDGENALAALLPMIDALHTYDKVMITSIAYSNGETSLHAVLPGHPESYETNPGIVLTIGGNGLLAFDNIAIGLATPELVEKTTLDLFAAMRPDEGTEPGPVGRRKDWLEMANAAAKDLSGRYAAS